MHKIKLEIHRLKRYGGHLSLVLIDLDRFKTVNDTYGHPAGDEVLQQVGQTIQSNIRNIDLVGRYGGEEFLVLLPNTDNYEACLIAERIRQAIESLTIEYNNHTIQTSISAGIISHTHNQVEHQVETNTEVDVELDIDTLIHKADKALYEAKSKGRNCTSCYSKPLEFNTKATIS